MAKLLDYIIHFANNQITEIDLITQQFTVKCKIISPLDCNKYPTISTVYLQNLFNSITDKSIITIDNIKYLISKK